MPTVALGSHAVELCGITCLYRLAGTNDVQDERASGTPTCGVHRSFTKVCCSLGKRKKNRQSDNCSGGVQYMKFERWLVLLWPASSSLKELVPTNGRMGGCEEVELVVWRVERLIQIHIDSTFMHCSASIFFFWKTYSAYCLLLFFLLRSACAVPIKSTMTYRHTSNTCMRFACMCVLCMHIYLDSSAFQTDESSKLYTNLNKI
jgi:hypothetical protein